MTDYDWTDDEKIALASGWTYVPYRSADGIKYSEWFPPNVSRMWAERNFAAILPSGGREFTPPDYLNDPGALIVAAEVVARCRGMTWAAKMEIVPSFDGGPYRARIGVEREASGPTFCAALRDAILRILAEAPSP